MKLMVQLQNTSPQISVQHSGRGPQLWLSSLPPQPHVSWSGEFLIVSPLLEFLISSLECLGKMQLQKGGCCYSVAKSCATICNPMDCSTQGFPVLHHLPEFAHTMSTEPTMLSNHLILCHSLLLLPSIFPGFRGFSNESVLHMRWPKYQSFSFSISAFNE